MVQRKTHSLTEGSIWKGLLFFAVPIMLSNLLQQMYNTIDSAVVGTWAGSAALAAVGSTGALINVLVGLFLGISTGAGVVYATYFGAKDEANLKRVMDNALILAVAAGIFLTFVGIAFTPKLLVLMGTPDDVLDLAVIYLRILFSGVTVLLVYNVGAGLIRAGGDSKRPLYYLVISGIVNLILDILFVAVLKRGVVGAAWATMLSQAMSAVLVVIHLMRMKTSYRLRIHTIRPNKAIMMQIIRLALPCGIQSSMFNIANLLVQVKINSFGSTAMAGVAAYTKVDGFVYMPIMALSLAISTFVGQNLGANQSERAKQGTKICVRLAVCVSAFMGCLVQLIGRQVLHLFTSDEQVIEFGVAMMHILASFAWTFSPSDILGGAMRGAGAATQVTIINALCICLFRILWLTFLLPVWSDIRLVFWVFPASWVLCTTCILIYYKKGNWMRRSAIESASKA